LSTLHCVAAAGISQLGTTAIKTALNLEHLTRRICALLEPLAKQSSSKAPVHTPDFQQMIETRFTRRLQEILEKLPDASEIVAFIAYHQCITGRI
jgi:hypothetical protein